MNAPRQCQSQRRPAFTVIEMLVALGLSTIVAGAAMAVFSLLPLAEPRFKQRFDDRLDLLITQGIIRDAMDSLVAARPLSPEEIEELRNEALALLEERADGDDDDDESPDGADADDPESIDDEPSMTDREADEAAERLAQLIESAGGDEQILTDMLVQSAFSDMPNFELHFETSFSGRTFPRLELVLRDSPMPVDFIPDEQAFTRPGVQSQSRVRGAFEILELENELILQWQPIEPPGLAVTIMSNLAWVEWFVLPRRARDEENFGWVEVSAAYLVEDYPLAVRIVLWTITGEYADWLFQTEVMTPIAQ